MSAGRPVSSFKWKSMIRLYQKLLGYYLLDPLQPKKRRRKQGLNTGIHWLYSSVFYTVYSGIMQTHLSFQSQLWNKLSAVNWGSVVWTGVLSNSGTQCIPSPGLGDFLRIILWLVPLPTTLSGASLFETWVLNGPSPCKLLWVDLRKIIFWVTLCGKWRGRW